MYIHTSSLNLPVRFDSIDANMSHKAATKGSLSLLRSAHLLYSGVIFFTTLALLTRPPARARDRGEIGSIALKCSGRIYVLKLDCVRRNLRR